MKRFVVNASSVFVIAALLGVTGCDSGGIETGVPKDVTQDPSIAKTVTDLAPINPPGVAPKKAPSTGTDATPGTPAEKKKD